MLFRLGSCCFTIDYNHFKQSTANCYINYSLSIAGDESKIPTYLNKNKFVIFMKKGTIYQILKYPALFIGATGASIGIEKICNSNYAPLTIHLAAGAGFTIVMCAINLADKYFGDKAFLEARLHRYDPKPKQ